MFGRKKVMLSSEEVATKVLLRALQCWGDSVERQIQTWQLACDFMRLKVTVSVSKNIFVLDGPNAHVEKANEFMKDVKGNFPIGSFESEVAMIERCLKKYKK